MENIFRKFLGKCWVIYQRPEMARLILEQICEDMRRVISSECSLVDMVPKGMKRSKSLPNLKQNRIH
jgi:hypothetical protein